MPWPPPTHMVSSPNCLSWNTIELIRVLVIRAPVMPNGWPSAMAPPLAVEVSADCFYTGGDEDIAFARSDGVQGHTSCLQAT